MKKGGDGRMGFAYMTRREFAAGLLSGAGLAAARRLGAVDREIVSLKEASHYLVLDKEARDDD